MTTRIQQKPAQRVDVLVYHSMWIWNSPLENTSSGCIVVPRALWQALIRCRSKSSRSVLAVADNEAVRAGGSNGLV